MTMYSLPNFCRVCLKYDKNLIDLAHIENEPNETLMSKLEQCVSEVDWSAYKPLLCHPCIKRLNVAFSFKKQCVQSAGVLKSYLELVKETQKKNESQNMLSGDPNSPGAVMVLPNQKYVKILLGGTQQQQQQQQNSFQNVFLNLIPTAGLSPLSVSPISSESSGTKSKDPNQNVFVNLNNTLQKFVPIAPGAGKTTQSTPKSKNSNNASINQLLTETKSEELSVEIDPTIFGLDDEDSEDSSENEENVNDWEDLISQSQINSKDSAKMNGDKSKLKDKLAKGNFYGNYVPILPKQGADFLNSGQHFLSGAATFMDENEKDFNCETCPKSFSSVKMLKHHIKLFHMGKYPFKCEYCYAEYVTRTDYDMCIKSHHLNPESSNTSLTLKDFANTSISSPQTTTARPPSPEYDAVHSPGEGPAPDGSIYTCELCRRPFSSSTGLLRHKVRKHNQKNKKKYFIKGMKNAKCDICNREFSTQSYMQLHRKLHMRDDVGYKYKVFGKSKYEASPQDGQQDGQNCEKDDNKEVEHLDVTPDISIDPDMEMEDDSDSDNERSMNLADSLEVEIKEEPLIKTEEHHDDEDDSDDNALKMDLDEEVEKKIVIKSEGKAADN